MRSKHNIHITHRDSHTTRQQFVCQVGMTVSTKLMADERAFSAPTSVREIRTDAVACGVVCVLVNGEVRVVVAVVLRVVVTVELRVVVTGGGRVVVNVGVRVVVAVEVCVVVAVEVCVVVAIEVCVVAKKMHVS